MFIWLCPLCPVVAQVYMYIVDNVDTCTCTCTCMLSLLYIYMYFVLCSLPGDVEKF